MDETYQKLCLELNACANNNCNNCEYELEINNCSFFLKRKAAEVILYLGEEKANLNQYFHGLNPYQIDLLVKGLQIENKRLQKENERLQKKYITSEVDATNLTGECVTLHAELQDVKKTLKYYLETNEEKGVVYFPKFALENILKNNKE